MEGDLANEVGLVVLDTIELFCGHFKVSALQCYFSVVVSVLSIMSVWKKSLLKEANKLC